MTRIVIDPAELAALSALCRNASYDAAGIATEAQYRVGAVTPLLGADVSMTLNALVDQAVALLQRVATELDEDALSVAVLGQRGAAADALGDMAGPEHSLLTRFDTTGETDE